MKREKSCGAVLFRRRAEGPVYLVLHSTQGHWTLCKGHVEGNETEEETARREIGEETGLTAQFLPGFRREISYSPAPGVHKDVIFFLGQAAEGPIRCQPEEVAEALFLPWAEAAGRLTHSSDRDTLSAARAFLEAGEKGGA